MQVVRVFTNEKGEWGNPHCIVLDFDHKMDDLSRQSFATNMGLSETVFVNDDRGNVNIYSPIRQCPYAGSALLGAAWYLHQNNQNKNTFLTTSNIQIPFWAEAEKIFIRMKKDVLPGWNYEQLSSPEDVEKLTLENTKTKEHQFVWAWVDESKGLVRARTFALDWGIPEDPANGSGSMRLASTLNREIVVNHGQGSIILARPEKINTVEVGGLVAI